MAISDQACAMRMNREGGSIDLEFCNVPSIVANHGMRENKVGGGVGNQNVGEERYDLTGKQGHGRFRWDEIEIAPDGSQGSSKQSVPNTSFVPGNVPE